MGLFSGNACFSPRVPLSIRKEWIDHGGTIENVHPSGTNATYVFCDGDKDPWFIELYQRSMVIFHWAWISAAVLARFPLPIAPYVIDGYGAGSANETPVTRAYIQEYARISKTSDKIEPRAVKETQQVLIKSGEYEDDDSLETLVWPQEGNSPTSFADLVAQSSGTISISDALDALQDVSTKKAARFIPGTTHLDKDFRCYYR